MGLEERLCGLGFPSAGLAAATAGQYSLRIPKGHQIGTVYDPRLDLISRDWFCARGLELRVSLFRKKG